MERTFTPAGRLLGSREGMVSQAARVGAGLVVAGFLFAPLGQVAAGHASWSLQHYCDVSLTLSASPVLPGASVTATLAWCQLSSATFASRGALWLDGAMVECRTSSVFTGGTHGFSFVLTAPSTAGIHLVYGYLTSTDTCPSGTSNQGFAHQDLAVSPQVIDATPPTTDHTFTAAPGSNGWWRSDVRVTLSATDTDTGVAATMKSVDGAPFTRYIDPFVIAGDGPHTLQYYSVDGAGNTEELRSAALKIDATPPEVSASAECSLAGNGGWCRGAVSMSSSASDATSGVASLGCVLDGTAAACPGLSVASDGAHEVSVTATDHAGNGATATIGFKVDATPPSVDPGTSCSVPGDNGWCRGRVDFMVTASDPTSGLAGEPTCSLDGAATACPGSASGDGHHALGARAEDLAGNGALPVFDVPIDATPPTAGLTAPRFAVGSFGVQVSAADATSGLGGNLLLERGSLLGAPFVGTPFMVTHSQPMSPGAPAFAGTIPQSPPPGHHCFRAAVRDVAGNTFTSYAPDVQAMLGAVKPTEPSNTSGLQRAVQGLVTVCTAKV